MIRVKDLNADLELNQLNVIHAKAKELLILDKVLCKFKCSVILVLVQDLLIQHPVIHVKDKE